MAAWHHLISKGLIQGPIGNVSLSFLQPMSLHLSNSPSPKQLASDPVKPANARAAALSCQASPHLLHGVVLSFLLWFSPFLKLSKLLDAWGRQSKGAVTKLGRRVPGTIRHVLHVLSMTLVTFHPMFVTRSLVLATSPG